LKRDFLSLTDLTKEEIFEILELSRELKEKLKRGEEHRFLLGRSMVMVFQKPSARTRVSFEVGMHQLGGYSIYLAPKDVQAGQREPIADLARALSRYCDVIVARMFGHEDILELAEYATVPVINGLTDLLHPCQVLSDIFTIWEKRGNLDNLHVAFVGDGNNVCNSWINLAARVPMRLTLGVPHGYEPDREILAMAKKCGVSEIEIYHNPNMAVKGADVVYTDVWTSMGQEREAERRREDFRDFQVNDLLLRHANEDCFVMHCLPAHRGEEITDSIIEGPQSIVFDQAENRLHVQKALLVKLLA